MVHAGFPDIRHLLELYEQRSRGLILAERGARTRRRCESDGEHVRRPHLAGSGLEPVEQLSRLVPPDLAG